MNVELIPRVSDLLPGASVASLIAMSAESHIMNIERITNEIHDTLASEGVHIEKEEIQRVILSSMPWVISTSP